MVVAGLGFTDFQSTLLQIPYGAFIVCMILTAIFISHKTAHLGVRTYLMAAVTVLTVLGFALMAFCPGTAGPLIGYCECSLQHATLNAALMQVLTGSSNAVFVLGLSLVTSNVGGTTKKVLASAAIFSGLAAGNIVGPYSITAKRQLDHDMRRCSA